MGFVMVLVPEELADRALTASEGAPPIAFDGGAADDVTWESYTAVMAEAIVGPVLDLAPFRASG